MGWWHDQSPSELHERALAAGRGKPVGLLEQFARAYMERERVKAGIPEQEREAAAAESSNLLRQAQAARALQELESAPEERDLRHRLIESQIRNYDEPNRLAAQPKAGTPHYEQDAQGNVTAIVPQPDGTFKTVPVGKVGTPRREPSVNVNMGRPQLRQTKDAHGNPVWTWISPGEEGVPVAPTANERQASGMALTIKDNIDKMAALANEVVAGPIAGRASQVSQSVLGPHGPEGTFDFLAKSVIDIVYVKSGKQINETEQAILRQMVPSRARGNLPEQVRLFGEYASGLLRKYGGADEGAGTLPAQPGGISPNVQRILDMIKARNAGQ